MHNRRLAATHARNDGRPRRHGPRFVLSNPDTWPTPATEHHTTDTRYGMISVQAWPDMHPKLTGRERWANHELPPIVHGTVICVEVEHLPRPTARNVKTLWLWRSGPGQADLDLVWRAYLRRFHIEHTFRYVKGAIGWTTPAVCTPEQADRWTWLTIAAYTQLRLARPVVAEHRLPWERPCEPHQLTPARTHCGFPLLRTAFGTPAHPPKSDEPGPGRPKGTREPPRTRHPAIRKTP